jgi:hypothetical protein
VTFGRAAEIHFHRNMPAMMAVNVPVPMDFEDGEGQVDIDMVMLVRAVLEVVGLLQRFLGIRQRRRRVRLRPRE